MQSVGNNYVLVYGITDHLLAKPLQKEVNAFKPDNETHEYMSGT